MRLKNIHLIWNITKIRTRDLADNVIREFPSNPFENLNRIGMLENTKAYYWLTHRTVYNYNEQTAS